MSYVKISEPAETPEEGRGKCIPLEHPLTGVKYVLALFQVDGKYFALTDQCSKCGGSLGRGALNGWFAFCSMNECAWNIKKGYCKFDRSTVLPTYKVTVEDDGLYIHI
ncbi:MAG: hypothetical protein GWO19_28145 [Nitrospinaceae bacterium]|nr:hypothetical protein [Nitrospinaceae bacterium]